MTFHLPKLIGHRGVKDLCPENTIDSIKKAIELNLKWIEVDVKISKDETLTGGKNDSKDKIYGYIKHMKHK